MDKSTYENKLLDTDSLNKVEIVEVDTDKDGVADVTVSGDVVRGTNGKTVKLDTDGDGKADKTVSGKIVSRKKKVQYVLISPTGNQYVVARNKIDTFKFVMGVDSSWSIK